MGRIIFRITLLASLAGMATIASADPWRLEPRVQRELQDDVDGLPALVRQAGLTVGERRALDRAVRDFGTLFERLSNEGLNRDEIALLQRHVNRIRLSISLEPRRWTSAP